jgi:hypothetical protein
MNINDTFPSNYLKASDLQNREVTVTISHVVNEKMGQDIKPILYFQNKQKGVVLNKTNAMTVAGMYGPETDHWAGRQVTLMSVWTDFQGKQVQAIRIKPVFPNPQMQAPIPQQAQPAPQPVQGQGQPHPGLGTPPELNDDIPW